MATTTTTNIKLVKPDYSEAADVQVLNGNADKIDAAFGETYNDLGIVVNGNKSALSAAAGQFVILKNSTISGRSDGLYIAAKAIPANTAIDSSYLTDVPGGGLNALNNNITIRSISSGDFNSIKATSLAKIVYAAESLENFTNKPSNVGNLPFALEVLPLGPGSKYTKQTLHVYGPSTTTYERQEYYYEGARRWNAWKPVVSWNIENPSWNSDHVPTRADNASVYKSGNLCQLVFWNVSWANTIATDTLVGTIPEGFRPPNNTFFYGFNRNNELCKGWLGANGNLYITTFPGDLMYTSCMYIAAY